MKTFEATVTKTTDPMQLGRIWVKAPGLAGENEIGPIRVLRQGGAIGTPNVGDTVLLLGESNNYYCIGVLQREAPVDPTKTYLDGAVLGVDALVRWSDMKKILDWLMAQFQAVPGHTHICAAPGAPTTATTPEATTVADMPVRLSEIAAGLPATLKARAT